MAASHRAGAQGGGGKRAVGLVVFGSMVAGTAGLGVWQTQRYFWKVEAMEARQALLEAPPVQLPLGDGARSFGGASGDGAGDADGPVSAEEDLSFRRVAVQGAFDVSRVALVGPRAPPKDAPPAARGTSNVGYYVVAPLVRADGSRVMVNVGWVPKHLAEGEAPYINTILTEHAGTVEGVISSGERKHGYSIANEPGSNHFFWIEVPALAAYTGVPGGDAALLIEAAAPAPASAAASEGTGRRKGQPQPQLQYPITKSIETFNDFYVTPFKHATYAATWFGLAIAGAFMTAARFRRPTRGRMPVPRMAPRAPPGTGATP